MSPLPEYWYDDDCEICAKKVYSADSDLQGEVCLRCGKFLCKDCFGDIYMMACKMCNPKIHEND